MLSGKKACSPRWSLFNVVVVVRLVSLLFILCYVFEFSKFLSQAAEIGKSVTTVTATDDDIRDTISYELFSDPVSFDELCL